jgi:23S rRNA (adenine-N6)-dimethyltransferase
MPSHRRTNLSITQNFLHSPKLVRRLVRQSTLDSDDLVVEIGPGKGIITRQLASTCRQVLAIEKDSKLAHTLRRRLAQFGNVTLFEADFLRFPLPISTYKVFASLPFNHTAAIIAQLTNGPTAPEDAFVIVQAEAAARFLGQPRETLAALLLKPWFEPTLLHRFQRSDFIPAPRVDVVLLRLKKRGPPLITADQAQAYRDFVTAVLTSWQPTVRAALCRLEDRATVRRITELTDLNLSQAPSRFPFAAWLTLFEAYRTECETRGSTSRITGAEARLRHQQQHIEKVHRTAVSGQGRPRGSALPK